MASATCAVLVCDRPAVVRGWCRPHYMRWRSKGDPGNTPIRTERAPFDERLERHVRKADGHWLWDGYVENGSGIVRIGRKTVRARRWVYENTRRTLGTYESVLVTCDEPLCVNPEHLSVGRREQNFGVTP